LSLFKPTLEPILRITEAERQWCIFEGMELTHGVCPGWAIIACATLPMATQVQDVLSVITNIAKPHRGIDAHTSAQFNTMKHDSCCMQGDQR
jgi:hypothetical protein